MYEIKYKTIIFIYIFIINICYGNVEEFFNNIKISHHLKSDFVIVGAGSSGSVVANKLSANPLNNVLLIEEGGYSKEIYKVRDTYEYSQYFVLNPNMQITKIFENAKYQETGNRNIESLRGKVCGGCNGINGMVASIGSDYDYDRWAEITNEPKWSWLKSINPKHLPDIFEHIPLRYIQESSSFNRELKQAILAAGFEQNDQPLNGTSFGFYLSIATQRKDEQGLYHRVTSFSQYVDTISRERENLNIIVKHKVLRIDFDRSEDPPRARGLYLKDLTTSEYVYIEIGKELILSAGAYDSPLLLQFSGVGDPQHLSKLGIETVINSPYVGKNLVDHLSLTVLGGTLEGIDSQHPLRPDEPPYNGYRIIGPKGITDNNQEVKWINSVGVIEVPLLGRRLLCSIEFVAPTSSGYLQIEKLTYNNETFKNPYLRVNHLSQPGEIEHLIEGVSSCRDIQHYLAATGTIQPQLIEVGVGINMEETNINRLKQSIRNNIGTAYHPHGTLRMGQEDDITSPTNGRLRLKGSSNIRIIDASVIPVSPSGNTNLPCMIIGLQGSSFILDEYRD